MAASSPAAEGSARPLSLSRSSGSLSRSQLRTGLQPVELTCPLQTLSKPVFEDRRSVPGPSSTSSLWMLNQLRPASSLHNRFIDRSTCSRRRRPSFFRVIPVQAVQTSKKTSRRSGLLLRRTPLLLKLVIEEIRHSPCCQTRSTDRQPCGAYRRPAGQMHLRASDNLNHDISPAPQEHCADLPTIRDEHWRSCEQGIFNPQ